MKTTRLFHAFGKAGKQSLLVGDFRVGAIIRLDAEGSGFTEQEGGIPNRLNPEVIGAL
jgi:hypothetical protein